MGEMRSLACGISVWPSNMYPLLFFNRILPASYKMLPGWGILGCQWEQCLHEVWPYPSKPIKFAFWLVEVDVEMCSPDPPLKEDMLLSCGDCGQQMASSCQLLRQRPTAPSPKVTPSFRSRRLYRASRVQRLGWLAQPFPAWLPGFVGPALQVWFFILLILFPPHPLQHFLDFTEILFTYHGIHLFKVYNLSLVYW